jgi:hypothetical protein
LEIADQFSGCIRRCCLPKRVHSFFEARDARFRGFDL